MDKSDISNFLKEQRKKIDKDIHRESDKRKVSSYHSRDEPYEEPSNTITIKGLPSDITEDDIKVSLDDMHADYIAVRLIKDRRTGINKGIAFVEFIAVNDAKDLMHDTRGELNISGHYGKLTYGYNVKEEVDRYDSEKTNAWKYEKPTNTVMLRGVSNLLSDNEVRANVTDVSKHVVDVRLIRDKKTGMSRGFGFVEFDSVAEAQRWMEYQQGYFMIEDSDMKLSYTSTRQGGTQISEYFTTDAGDWSCARCGGHNFKRRDFCYKCHLSKTQSKSVMETIDGKDQIGTSPCNTLILRDLDALTLEDAIVKALQSQFKVNVNKCEIMRDDVTKVSRCFAFAELSSLHESQKIVEYYEDNPDKVFELSEKAVTINYAKNSFNTLIISYKEALAKRFEETYEPPAHETSNYDANAAAAVAQAALNQKKMHKIGGTGPGSAVVSTVLPSNVIVDGRTQESTAMCFELIVNGQRCTSVPTNPFSMADLNTSTFTKPETSKFLYDQSTQYYFDPITGLYYDTNSQYFFDRVSQQYLYWNMPKATFVPVETPAKAGNLSTDNNKIVHKDGKKSKSSEAKKIAKEMERWEKMMNSKKDIPLNNFVKRDNSSSAQVMKAAAADSGFAMFTDNRANYCPMPQQDRGLYSGDTDHLVAAYHSDSDNDNVIMTANSNSSTTTTAATKPYNNPITNESSIVASLIRDEEEKLINWDKMACHLCNRGFKDKATLENHISVSDLHKKNMEQLKEKLSIVGSNRSSKMSAKMKYRDRAKERREKFGVPSSIKKSRYDTEDDWDELGCNVGDNSGQGMSTSSVSGTSDDSDTIGSRLMAKMGWQQGQGLGKLNQGRTEVVQAEFIARGAGIGAAPKFQGTPSDNYRENLKRAMYAKYHDG